MKLFTHEEWTTVTIPLETMFSFTLGFIQATYQDMIKIFNPKFLVSIQQQDAWVIDFEDCPPQQFLGVIYPVNDLPGIQWEVRGFRKYESFDELSHACNTLAIEQVRNMLKQVEVIRVYSILEYAVIQFPVGQVSPGHSIKRKNHDLEAAQHPYEKDQPDQKQLEQQQPVNKKRSTTYDLTLAINKLKATDWWDDEMSSILSKIEKSLDQDAVEGRVIFPPAEHVFDALLTCSLKDVLVVINGQNPYINDGEAHGLCFSVKKGIEIPPSLKNIFKIARGDAAMKKAIKAKDGCLTSWAEQGILLLNTHLTVLKGDSKSHMNLGWDKFTGLILQKCATKKMTPIFLLWGKPAQKLKPDIQKAYNKKNPEIHKLHILETSHPSPLGFYKGFDKSNHFKDVNDILDSRGISPIVW